MTQHSMRRIEVYTQRYFGYPPVFKLGFRSLDEGTVSCYACDTELINQVKRLPFRFLDSVLLSRANSESYSGIPACVFAGRARNMSGRIRHFIFRRF